MKTSAKCALLIIVSSFSIAQTAPSTSPATAPNKTIWGLAQEKFKASEIERLDSSLKALNADLSAMKSGKIKALDQFPNQTIVSLDPKTKANVYQFPSDVIKKNEIADQTKKISAVTKQIIDLKSSKSLPSPHLPDDFTIGDVGICENIKVIQVINDTEALADISPSNSSTPRTVYLKSVNASKWVDDKTYSLSTPLIVSGKRTYSSQGGQRTVFEIRPLTAQEIGN